MSNILTLVYFFHFVLWDVDLRENLDLRTMGAVPQLPSKSNEENVVLPSMI